MPRKSSQVRRLLLILMALGYSLMGKALTPSALGDSLNAFVRQYACLDQKATISVSNIRQRNNHISVYTRDDILTWVSLSEQDVRSLQRRISYWVAGDSTHRVELLVNGKDLSSYITSRFRGRPLSQRHRLQPVTPLVSNISRPFTASQGLDGKHIALWGSHGLYYQQKEDRWRWQRARLWTTVEDLFTSQYTHSFLVPMLENAGAIVIQPRERDIQTQEVIADDRDAIPSGYSDNWEEQQGNGWGYSPRPLSEGENPFRMGHYRKAPCSGTDTLCYYPHFTVAGDYAVYVSYASIPHATEHAVYTLIHQGDTTRFMVNQTMGGGTWIYLGTFAFGTDSLANRLMLSSPKESGKIVTADAVRFGGGMGSVARKPFGTDSTQYGHTSGYPRFMEGARYYMQYSGIPDSIYNFSKGQNDYTDDFASRGRWVNYLAGGSEALRNENGLGIPVNLCMALHSDAGNTMNSDIIGTLAIYTDRDNDKHDTYPAGGSRQCNRDLADLMQTQVVEDVRRTLCPSWTRRALKNASYSESRNPKVPCALLELLSHQNFADMQLGLDPRFQFVASRAIYKAIVRFLHQQDGTPYVIQPLPPYAFAIQKTGDSIRLTWRERVDTLEATARPSFYVLYTRPEGHDWDNGQFIAASDSGGTITLSVRRGIHYDLQICAGNEGGISLPSEVLSACLQPYDTSPIAVIMNGFHRVAPPIMVAVDSLMGGILPHGHAIAYKENISYIGEQIDFDRSHPWRDDDDCGFGFCNNDFARRITQGNTFNYISLHGRWLKALGYSYVSRSVSSEEQLDDCHLLDLILGKQQSPDGCIPTSMQQTLSTILSQGGKVLISGSYVGSNMQSKAAMLFTESVLHYRFHAPNASHSGEVTITNPAFTNREYTLHTQPNAEIIECEAPDGIEPVRGAERLGWYTDSGISLGIAFGHQILVLPFMLESLQDNQMLYNDCIHYLQ